MAGRLGFWKDLAAAFRFGADPFREHRRSLIENGLVIPKATVAQKFTDWGAGRITTAELSGWCCGTYRPGAVEIDPDIPEWQQDAMVQILSDFEWQSNDSRITGRPENSHLALAFLNSTRASYADAKRAFQLLCAGYTEDELD